MGTLSDNLRQVVNAGPDLRSAPGIAVTLAQAGASDEDAGAVAGRLYSKKWQKFFDSLPDDGMRRRYWQQMSDAQRTFLSGNGVKVASADKPADPSWFSQFLSKTHLDDVAGAAGDVLTGVWDATKAVGGEVLDAMNYPLDQVKHIQRTTLDAVVNDGNLLPLAGAAVSPMFGGMFTQNPREFVRRYRETQDGEKSYNQSQLRKIRDQYTPEVFDLAKRQADGEDPSDIVAEYAASHGADAAAGLTRMFQSSDYNRALKDISGAHLSVGRQIAGALGLQGSDTWFGKVSGVVDAANSVLMDPLLVAGKAKTGFEAARYGVRAVDDVERVFTLPAVTRKWDDVMPHVDTLARTSDDAAKGEAFAYLTSRHKDVKPELLQDLVSWAKAEPGRQSLTAADAKDYFTSLEGFKSIVKGDGISRRVPLMQRQNQVQAWWAKHKPGTVVDWTDPKLDVDASTVDVLKSDPSALGDAAAQFNRTRRGRLAAVGTRASQRSWDSGKLYLAGDLGDRSSAQVYAMARSFLPKHQASQIAGTWTAADVAGRRQIAKGLVLSLGRAAGIDDTPEGAKWLSKFADDAFDTGKRAYDHTGRKVAVFDGQTREYVSIPTFADMYAQARKLSFGQKAIGVSTGHAIDQFMSRAWRPAVLLRPALMVRNAGEEMANLFLRTGVRDWATGRQAALRGRDPLDHISTRALLKMIPESKRQNALDMRGWLTEHFDEQLAKVTRTNLSDQQKAWVDDLSQDSVARDSFINHIMEGATNAAAQRTVDSVAVTKVRDGRRLQRVSWRPRGEYRAMDTAGEDGALRWLSQLEMARDDRAVNAVVDVLHDPALAKQQMVAYMSSAAYRRQLKQYVMQDAQGGVRTVEDLAQQKLDEVRHLLSDAQGNLNDDLVERFKAGTVDHEFLAGIAEDLRPASVAGTDYINVLGEGSGLISNITENGFAIIGDFTSRLSRDPQSKVAYLRARERLQPWQAEMAKSVGEQEAARMATREAFQAAVAETLNYVDNSAIRSQGAVVLRNLFPFWRAQEEFVRRWARTFKYSPEALRKAQLVMEGFTHSGMVQVDDQGNQYVVYPLTAPLQNVIQRVGQHFGWTQMLPINYQLRGQVRFMNQGLTAQGWLPSAGPLAALPLQAVTQVFPELNPATRTLLGDQAAGRGVMGSLLPSWVQRLQAIGNPDASQYQSAMRQAMAYMEYAGLTPPEDATPAQIDTYQEQIKKWARGIMMLRFVYGTSAPAAPESMDVAPEAAEAFRREGMASLKDEWRALSKKLTAKGVPYEEALGIWLKANPETLPFTVGQTEGKGGSSPAATRQALDWLQKNREIVDKFPVAAAYLLPQESGDFNQDAWRIELANGLREYKTTDTFYRDLKTAGQLQQYFDMRDQVEQAKGNARVAGDSDRVSQLNEAWSEWSARFKTMNPLVQDYLNESGRRAAERDIALNQIRDAVTSGVVTGSTGNLFRDVIGGWDSYRQARSALGGRDEQSVTQKSVLDRQFDRWVRERVGSDANGLMLYNKLFRYMEDGQ